MFKLKNPLIKQTGKIIASLLVVFVAFQMSAYAQNRQVTGTVYDQSGGTLPGVNVVIKGTTVGTITDIDGNYSLELTGNDTELVFSFVGFLDQVVSVNNQSRIDITLLEDMLQLDEVVAIGYGVQKKSLNTGANLNVKGDDIQKLNTSSTMDALKGMSPGVSITQNSGLPGSGNKIFIRGIGTTGNYNPLYIVDGVAVGSIDNLSPSDIESLDILKDAASAAIYGSRGANGVVLVTTRKGRASKTPTVNYSAYYGLQNVYKGPGLLNAQQYAELVQEANQNAGAAPFKFEEQVPNWDKIQSGEWQGTNWFEEITDKNAPVQIHSINVTGGSDISTFSMGASYLNQQGILGKQANNDYKRINLRFNSEHVLMKSAGRNIIVFGENFTFTNEKKPTIRTGNIYLSDVHNMVVASPFLPMYAEDEDDKAYPYHYAIKWNTQEANPVASMVYNSKWNTNNNNTIIGNAYLNIEPVRNLTIRSSFGVNNWYGSSRQWRPAYALSDVSNAANDYARQEMFQGFTWTSTNTIGYNLNLGNSNISALIGNEFIKNTSTLNIYGSNEKSVFNDPEYAYLDNFDPLDAENAALASFGGRDSYGWAMVSYFGRLSYNYSEKYLATMVLRYDASSNFARGHRWGSFPSASAGWVISNEDFMQDVSFIDMAKLRLSWGQNGNQDIGRNFVYLSTIDITGVNYFFGPDKSLITVGSTPSQVPNPLIEWEKSEQTNFGLDMNFANNRMQVALDWYRKDTKDWLVEKIASSMDGTNPPWVNGGLVRNSGLEGMVRWIDGNNDFKYDATLTMAYNKNEVLEIPSEDSIYRGPSHVLSQGQSSELYRAEAGFPIGYFWGLETDGIFQNQAEADAWVRPEGADKAGEPYYSGRQQAQQQLPGDVKFVDQNGDGIIDNEDKVMIGNPHPKIIMGLQINLDYKGFYLNVTGNGMFGHQVAMNYRSIDSYRHNFTEYDLGRWHGEGTSDRLPRLFQGAHRNTQFISDIFIHDADFFRISNLTVGYNFSKLSSKVPFKEARLYVAATNLYTFTKYPGMDPEVGYAPDSWGSGIDLGLYPQARTFMIGTNITF
ncbi:MAG TPA: TonB-dependent receptor [Prolixibacteraceae bacterium]|jgi:TonB-linked SusC/RagA family outer membrane protein|nr:TonB-dependent receptor [Prolixibacteraceae bacterium]